MIKKEGLDLVWAQEEAKQAAEVAEAEAVNFLEPGEHMADLAASEQATRQRRRRRRGGKVQRHDPPWQGDKVRWLDKNQERPDLLPVELTR